MTPETELILELCRSRISGAPRARVTELLQSQLDWELFFARAGGWQVEPVVMSSLRSMTRALPPEIAARAALRERESRAVALSGTLIVLELLQRFKDTGIPVIVLKGPAVGVAAYGDPSMRPFGDVDLLVARNDLAPARNLLISLGYERDYQDAAEAGLIADQHALEFSSSREKVDLHWALLSRYLRFDIDASELWDSSVILPCAGREIRSLAPGLHLLFVCAHAAKHGWASIRWICDVAYLVQRLEPGEIARAHELASRTHSRLILATGLRLARELLGAEGAPPPNMSVSQAKAGPLVDSVLQQLGSGGPTVSRDLTWLLRLEPALGPLLFWARSRERWTDRVACVMRIVFVPPGDGRLSPLRWATRPIRLAARVIHRMRTKHS